MNFDIAEDSEAANQDNPDSFSFIKASAIIVPLFAEGDWATPHRHQGRKGENMYKTILYALLALLLIPALVEPPIRGNKTWTALGRVTGGGNDPASITDPAVLANSVPHAARLYAGLERVGTIGEPC